MPLIQNRLYRGSFAELALKHLCHVGNKYNYIKYLELRSTDFPDEQIGINTDCSLLITIHIL